MSTVSCKGNKKQEKQQKTPQKSAQTNQNNLPLRVSRTLKNSWTTPAAIVGRLASAWKNVMGETSTTASSKDENVNNTEPRTSFEDREIEDLAHEMKFTYSNAPFVFEEPKPSANLTVLRKLALEILPPKASYLKLGYDSEGAFFCAGDHQEPLPLFHDELLELVEDAEYGYFQKNYRLRVKLGLGQSIGLYAGRDLPEGTPFGVDTGAVWHEDRFNQMMSQTDDQMMGLYATDIDRTLFLDALREVKSKFKYPKGPSLVYDSTTHGNEMRFLQDSSWCSSSRQVEATANVGSFVVITRKAPHVHLVYFTLVDVKKDDELVVYYGDNTWDTIYVLQLAGRARIARHFGRRLEYLQTFCAGHDIEWPQVRSAKRARLQFNDANDFTISRAGQKASKQQQALERNDPLEAALQKIQRGYRNPFEHVDPANLELQMTDFVECPWPAHVMQAETMVSSVISQFITLRFTTEDRRAWRADEDALQRVSEGRQAERFLRLVRIQNPYHPVRLFCRPDEQDNCFAILAKSDVPIHYPVAQYTGELLLPDEEDEQVDQDNAYVFELSSLSNRGYSGRLVVNAESKGGLARFINDCWVPQGFEERKANCEVKLVVDRNTAKPMLVLYTLKEIKKDEELLIEYGRKEYWDAMFKNMLNELTEYSTQTCEQCQAVVSYLQKNHKALANQLQLPKIPGVKVSS